LRDASNALHSVDVFLSAKELSLVLRKLEERIYSTKPIAFDKASLRFSTAGIIPSKRFEAGLTKVLLVFVEQKVLREREKVIFVLFKVLEFDSSEFSGDALTDREILSLSLIGRCVGNLFSSVHGDV